MTEDRDLTENRDLTDESDITEQRDLPEETDMSGETGERVIPITEPEGVEYIADMATCRASGNVYLSCMVDTKGWQVIFLDCQYKFIKNIDTFMDRKGYPVHVSSANSYLVLTQFNNEKIIIIDSKSDYSKIVMTQSRGITRCVIDSNNTLYICDLNSRCISVLDMEGTRKYVFGQDELQEPRHIEIFRDRLYVYDWARQSVYIFSLNGELVERPIELTMHGNWFFTSSVAFVPDREQIILADWFHDCVYVYSTDGPMRKIRLSLSPRGLVLTPRGHLVLLHSGENRNCVTVLSHKVLMP
jgi:hypothetical protein